MKNTFLIIIISFLSQLTFAQTATLSGHIKDKKNGEALIGATCYFLISERELLPNEYGYYSITVPAGTYKISFSYIGYETQNITLDLSKNQVFNILLADENKELDAVTVVGTRKDRNIESTEMSMEKLPVKLVKKLPSFMGEVDVLKTITLLPGIQSGGEGSSGLYVRGGGPDENLLLLDEAPVYNASHLMGFFSVFNSDAIKDIQVYKGGIPAEYGGKASSVIDIRMKDGNSQQLSGQAGIGNISSRLTLEGPIIKDKWSFIVSGRRTYADVVGRMIGIDELKDNQLYFYDLNLKTNIEFSHKDRVYISAYTGDDYFKLGESLYMRWGNITGTARWNHIFNGKLFSNTSLIYSKYDYSLGVPSNSVDQFDWNSRIEDFNFKQDFSWFLNTNNKIDFGLNIIKHHFEPGNIETNESSFFEPLKLTNYNAISSAAYVSNEQKFGSLLTIKYGLRLSVFQQIGIGKLREYENPEKPQSDEIVSETSYKTGDKIGSPFINFEPRISAKISTGETSSVKTSYNRMAQNLHLISNTNSPTPLDIWLPSNKYIKPLIVNQVAAGYFRNFSNNTYETSLEFYYKDMQNVLDYKDGAELFLNEDLETELLTGTGYAYGMEIMIKKQEGQFTGWVSYTLAKSMREIPGINNGDPYPSTYDRTHDFSLVTNYDINKRISLSASWVFSTGNPVTYPVAKYNVQGNTLFYYSDRNSNRIPDYHRLDFSFNYNFKKNEYRKVKQLLNVSLYNVYGRRNAYSIYFRPNEDNPAIIEATRLSILGTMIPSITYNINF
ncbi:MAG: TonB-dependent receptor [Draconibacterium sp.]|nr:TonB-dependent receptor [Draconibacterium sp.]